MSMNDQVVLITGSSGGIGGAIVTALEGSGATVVGADRAPRADRELAAFLPLDVTSEDDCVSVVAAVEERFGRVDVLIHAAGVLGTTPDPLQTTTTEFEEILRINLSGTYSMVRHTALSMRRTATKGAMVLLSSVAAKEARKDYLPYNTSKLAVLHIMWSMAEMLGPDGISVNAVAPGPVNTDMWAQKARDSGTDAAAAQAARNLRASQLPMRRFAEPDEVARAILFLADPRNRYITGISLDVAGGGHLGMGS